MVELQTDDRLMQLLQWLAIALTAISLLVILDISQAWFRLRNHAHIETVEDAKPEIANDLKCLIADISAAAEIPAPSLFIRRAAMPNAFVAAAISRPELYLTDELLEQCDNSLDELTKVICHEIAHIQRGDALKLGLLNYGARWSNKLTLIGLENTFLSAINNIEDATDKQAEVIFQRLIDSDAA